MLLPLESRVGDAVVSDGVCTTVRLAYMVTTVSQADRQAHIQ